jgi:predicted enzyme related to lactoylglutathione lyase
MSDTVIPTRLDFASIQVRDLARSRRFYESTLGFEAGKGGPLAAVVFRSAGGATFAIRTPLVDLDAVPRLGWGIALWFAWPNVDEFHGRLVALGVPILRAPENSPFGRVFACADPDGYVLTFHEGDKSL